MGLPPHKETSSVIPSPWHWNTSGLGEESWSGLSWTIIASPLCFSCGRTLGGCQKRRASHRFPLMFRLRIIPRLSAVVLGRFGSNLAGFCHRDERQPVGVGSPRRLTHTHRWSVRKERSRDESQYSLGIQRATKSNSWSVPVWTH